MKVHVLTGCYFTKQVGSKISALQNDSKSHLTQFREDLQLIFDSARKGEEYVVKVLKPQSASKTIGKLRL